ncbi:MULTISPECIES: Ger(x)C family spore germination protein [Bacillaceae]|uniref:Spore gernimation protein KC n=1 Tax=Domibacillus aminovorans TaxID=29332 RepID=A0A177KXC8_9BACI|nr:MULTISPECIES: Ger(x)C family spore germination protein [Bacillaceae]OAH57983.1 spore gernimation protein KC [Domibacillus aminovorans]
MNRKGVFLFLLVISVCFLSGCWSKRELTDLAFISAYALDLNEEGNYEATIQVINPGNITSGLQGGGGGSSSPPVIVYSVTGENLSDMDALLTKKLSRAPYYAHTDLVVISEELAKEEGLPPILDELDRDIEFRTTTAIVIAKETKAKDLLTTLTGTDRIPSTNIVKTLDETEKILGENLRVDVHELITQVTSTGKEPLLSGFTLKGDPLEGKTMENVQSSELEAAPEADGLAVFKEGKLIDWIEGETARGTLWTLDKIKTTTVSMSWEKEKKAIAYKVMRQKTKVSATLTKGEPTLSISTRAEGDIAEVKVPVDLMDLHVIKKIEKELEKEIKNEIEKAVQQAQKDKSDIFGFGEVVHRTDPKAWKKLEKEWNDRTFAELDVDVKVEAFIRRTGLVNNSLHTTLKKEGE